MQEYRLSFFDWDRPADRDVSAVALFRVERGETSRMLALGATGTCAVAAGVKDPEELKTLLLRAGLRAARDLLRRGAFDSTPNTQSIDVTFRSDQVAQLLARRYKYCRYKRDSETGPVCAVAAPDDPLRGMTLDQLCQDCGVPDSDLACAYLVHLSTSGLETLGEPRYSRHLDRVACNRGRPVRNSHACIPDGCQDWAQVVIVSPPEEHVPSDVIDRIVDEIDFLNLVFKDRYQERLLHVSQARTIRDVGLSCQNESDFTHLIAVTADLLAGIRIPDRLLGNPEAVKGKGSLTRLGAFLEAHHPEFDKTRLQQLKSITAIRNTYPIHSRTEGVLAGFECLSIPYPIDDWQDAGRRVLGALWGGLRHLRTLIQYSREVTDGTD